jgi:hypothetical protein
MDFDELQAWLEEHKFGILGIEGSDAASADVIMKLVSDRLTMAQGEHFAARWVAEFQHGDKPARTLEDTGKLTFLGQAATGQRVTIHGSIFGLWVGRRDEPPIRDLEVYWNHMEGLAQIGVRAVGRPIVAG